MLVQRSARDTTATAAQLTVLAGQPSVSTLQYGGVARLGRDVPAAVTAWLAAVGAHMKVADPECWTRSDQHNEVSSNFVSYFPHLTLPLGTAGSTDRGAWLDAVVKAQTGVGATVILTPGLWVGPGGRVTEETALVAPILARAGDMPVWLNVALHHSHIINSGARAQLIADLLSAGIGQSGQPEAVYMRAQLPSYSPSYTEPRRKGFPEGLADVVRALAEAGVPAILPNSGVTGWVMMGLGARGLGTGVSWAQRAWLEPGGGPLGQGRYFEADMLHTVPAVAHLAIQRSARTAPCACQWCGPLWNAGPVTMPTPWDYELAGQHYLPTGQDELRPVVHSKSASVGREPGVLHHEFVFDRGARRWSYAQSWTSFGGPDLAEVVHLRAEA